MSDIIILFLLWAIMFIVAFVFIPLWRRHRDAGAGLYDRTQDDNKLSINYALKRLNCKVKWEKDHEDLIGSYTFQRGRFRIRLEKNSPYVRLSYLFFFTAGLQHIETVRAVCNRCNLNSETCRLTYTVDNDRGEVDAHIVNALLLNDSTVCEVLERAMENIFLWQRRFQQYYEESASEAEHLPGHDGERAEASIARDRYLAHELEMMHQDEGPSWHVPAAEPLSLERLLGTVLGLSHPVPSRMTVVREGQGTVIDDVDEILGYDIASVLIRDGAFAWSEGWLLVDYYDPRRPVHLRRLSVALHEEGRTDHTLYYRATLSLSPLSLSPEVPLHDAERERRMGSVLIGYDLRPVDEQQAEFRYLRKEALAKQQAGRSAELTDDERTLCSLTQPDVAWTAWRGRVLYEEARYYEAVSMLENLYLHLQAGYEHMSIAQKQVMADVCYLVGSCYAHLGEYRRALFYLQIVQPMRRHHYIEAFVNCLVSSHDFRAMDYIDSYLRELQPVVGEEREDDTEGELHEAVAFVNFLRRRKVSVLVDRRHYDEAERLLKQLLDDPANSDFALRELAYIQQQKGRQEPVGD